MGEVFKTLINKSGNLDVLGALSGRNERENQFRELQFRALEGDLAGAEGQREARSIANAADTAALPVDIRAARRQQEVRDLKGAGVPKRQRRQELRSKGLGAKSIQRQKEIEKQRPFGDAAAVAAGVDPDVLGQVGSGPSRQDLFARIAAGQAASIQTQKKEDIRAARQAESAFLRDNLVRERQAEGREFNARRGLLEIFARQKTTSVSRREGTVTAPTFDPTDQKGILALGKATDQAFKQLNVGPTTLQSIQEDGRVKARARGIRQDNPAVQPMIARAAAKVQETGPESLGPTPADIANDPDSLVDEITGAIEVIVELQDLGLIDDDTLTQANFDELVKKMVQRAQVTGNRFGPVSPADVANQVRDLLNERRPRG